MRRRPGKIEQEAMEGAKEVNRVDYRIFRDLRADDCVKVDSVVDKKIGGCKLANEFAPFFLEAFPIIVNRIKEGRSRFPHLPL